MQFGYFFTLYNTEQRPYHEVLQQAVDQTRLAEEVGFDCIWMGEHHFGGEGYDVHPNPILTAAHLAARTERIRIGLAAVILAGWHPLRLAEDLAVLDHITGGRLEVAVGRGITNREITNLTHFEVDRRYPEANWAMFLENLSIIRKAWTEDPFHWKGDFFTFPRPGVQDSYADWYPRNPDWRAEDGEYVGMSIQPKPLQQPHPPLWNVLDSGPSFVVAAEQGLKPITWLRSQSALHAAFAKYRDVASEVQGRNLRLGEDCAVLRACYVAETREEARRIAEPAVERLYRDYIGGLRSREIYAEPGEVLSDEDLAKPWFDFLHERGHLFIGTPDDVSEQIESVRNDVGLENLLTMMWLPELKQPEIERSLTLFGKHVLPAFA